MTDEPKKMETLLISRIPPDLKRAIQHEAIDQGLSLRQLTINLWRQAAAKYLDPEKSD